MQPQPSILSPASYASNLNPRDCPILSRASVTFGNSFADASSLNPRDCPIASRASVFVADVVEKKIVDAEAEAEAKRRRRKRLAAELASRSRKTARSRQGTGKKAQEQQVNREVADAWERGDFKEAEKVLGESKVNRLGETYAKDVVSKLWKKSQSPFFDKPVDPEQAPDYYADLHKQRTAWDTEAICFETMEKKADLGMYDKDAYTSTSRVEADFTIMVLNAIIYNPADHPVNKAALKLYKSARPFFAKLAKDALMCRLCHGDELSVENPVQICDFCCTGLHVQCQGSLRQAGSHVGHPLQPERTDAAWFCSDHCEATFKRLVGKCLLPPEPEPKPEPAPAGEPEDFEVIVID